MLNARSCFFPLTDFMSAFLSMPHTPLGKLTVAKRRDLTQWHRTGCVEVPGFGSLSMPITKWVFLEVSTICLSLLLHFTAQKLKSADPTFSLTSSISECWERHLYLDNWKRIHSVNKLNTGSRPRKDHLNYQDLIVLLTTIQHYTHC